MKKKKLIPLLAAFLLLSLVHTSVMAETTVLEIDQENDLFKTEVWQNDGDKNVWPLRYATEISPLSGDASKEEGVIKRFCGTVMQGDVGVEGSPVLTDGVSNFSVYFPLKQASSLNKITLKFPVGARRYFFRLFTSADGTSWNEAVIRSGADKITVTKTYGTGHEVDGPGVECYASVPAGVNAQTGDANLTIFSLDKVENVKYIKFTFYGNDAGSNFENVVANRWVSFNNLIFENVEETESTSSPTAANSPNPGTATPGRPATATATGTSTGSTGSNVWLIALIAGGVIVVLLILVLTVRSRKKG